ncbi:MAG: universal stress protein [Planctomycetota bacterium]|nr:MAG: universal stress protein [Planctomycetota bacterium]
MSDTHIKPIRRILVGTGLTQESVGAVLLSRWLAEKLGAELHAVHVIVPISPAAEQAMPGMAEQHEKQALEELDKFAQTHGLRDFAKLHVARGQPDAEIIKLSTELDTDLLVMGRYGRGGLKHGMLGAVADRVVRRNPTSVLVVQPEFRGPIRKLGVASACEDELNLELERALDLAGVLGIERIPMIKAYDVPAGYHMLSTYEEAAAKLAEVHERIARQQVERASAGISRAVQVDIETRLGSPAKILPEFAEESELDLLVIGTHSRTGMAELVLDNLSEQIVKQATCNIWAEKSPVETQTLRGLFKSLLS